MQTRADEHYRLTTLEEVKQDFLKNAKTSKFHFFKKIWLKKQWELYPELRLKCVIQCYRTNRIDTETYFNLCNKIKEENAHEQSSK